MVTHPMSPERSRHAFDWPEPLIIDLVAEIYGALPQHERLLVARLHARALRQQVDGDRRGAALGRLDLLAACAARGIGMSSIEDADRAAFGELLDIARRRYRMSPQRRDELVERLSGAMAAERTRPTSPGVATRGVPRGRGLAAV